MGQRDPCSVAQPSATCAAQQVVQVDVHDGRGRSATGVGQRRRTEQSVTHLLHSVVQTLPARPLIRLEHGRAGRLAVVVQPTGGQAGRPGCRQWIQDRLQLLAELGGQVELALDGAIGLVAHPEVPGLPKAIVVGEAAVRVDPVHHGLGGDLQLARAEGPRLPRQDLLTGLDIGGIEARMIHGPQPAIHHPDLLRGDLPASLRRRQVRPERRHLGPVRARRSPS